MTRSEHARHDERSIIGALRPYLNFSPSDRYPLDIGDDTALRNCTADERLVFTGDTLVEDVDFKLRYMSLAEVGFKAIAVNVSDCAAMGAMPESALVQVVAPSGTLASDSITQLYQGIGSACRQWNLSVIGGDLSSGPAVVVSVTCIGRIPPEGKVIGRRGARPGDLLWVSGYPGRSAAGLGLLARGISRAEGGHYAGLIDAHVQPVARVELGRVLGRDEQVHCMIDVSDGISSECTTLCLENSVSILLESEAFPLEESLVAAAQEMEIDPLNFFLHGGEDFELLFSTGPDFVPPPREECAVAVTRIGMVGKGPSAVSIRTGKRVAPLEAGGFDHFR